MALLPINVSHIITPYLVYGEENTSVLQAVNNRVYVSRGGGYRYKVTLSLRPFTILSSEDATIFEGIRMFLTKYPQMDIPVLNVVDNLIPAIDVPEILDHATYNQPGQYVVYHDPTSYSNNFTPGQFISFSNKAKVYQIESISGNNLTLTQRLRQTLTSAHTINHVGYDTSNVLFNGVTGGFVNEDFGNPVASINGGILGQINTLSLIENI